MLENWQKNEPISIIADDGENEQEYRLTFGTMSVLDEARFKARRAKAVRFVKSMYEKDAWQGDGTEEFWQVLELAIKHAAIIATLRKVEIRDGKKWNDSELPRSWLDIEVALGMIPAVALLRLYDAVLDAGNHPRVLGALPTAEDEKKMIRLSVSRSEN